MAGAALAVHGRAHGRAGAGVWEETGQSRRAWPATLGKKAPWESLWTDH